MVKMKDRNAQLKSSLGKMASKETVQEIQNLPEYDTVNRQGYAAYSLSDELRLISMLNTLKIESQYYRSEREIMTELRDLIERIGVKDPYFLAQCIVYSRCIGEGMRSINHFAAALAAPFISGLDFAKRFYGPFNKSTQSGGCIYRPDDMSEIKDVYSALNEGTLSNAMKKGFAKVIESLDGYILAKYKKSIIDISNLVHPNSNRSKAVIEKDGKQVKVLDCLMQGITVSADTWEVAQSEAGQEVAKAVKAGKISKAEAEEVLSEAMADNWEQLLKEGKLGILAALRNIRNMLKNPRPEIVKLLCDFVSDGDRIRKGKIMPYQIDYAYEITKKEFSDTQDGRMIINALLQGYEAAVPNLVEALPGRTCVMVDCSGSMHWNNCYLDGKYKIQTTAAEKAGLIAATIAKATNADIIQFGSNAKFFKYDLNTPVFELGRQIGKFDMGGTNLGPAFNLINDGKRVYERIILLSDNEFNYILSVVSEYANYIRNVCSPYVYTVDLASYGTVPIAGDKVTYYYGYGMSMFTDIATKEFNAQSHIDKVRKVVI